MVGSLLGGTNLNYVAHKGCIRISILDTQNAGVFGDQDAHYME